MLLAAVVLLTLLLIWASALCDRCLGGHWVGDPGFLARAGLGDLQLFLGPRAPGGRAGYLVATAPDGAFLANTALSFCGGPWPWAALAAALGGAAPFRAALRADTAPCAGAAPRAAPCAATLSVACGTLTLSGFWGRAVLRKDHAASAAAAAAYRK